MTDQIQYKDPGIDSTHFVEWHNEFVFDRKPNTQYTAGQVVKAPVETGWYYLASVVEGKAYGRTGELTPQFPTASGETVQDGTIIWIALHPADHSPATITQSDWVLDAGLTEVSKSISGFITAIEVAGGDAGEQYRVVNNITRSDGSQDTATFVIELNNPPDV